MADQQETTKTTTQEQKNVRQVLVAVDESDESIFALRWVLDNLILHQPNPHQVYILHVEPTLNLYPAPGYFITPEMMDSLKKSREKTSMEILQRAQLVCDEKHVSSKTVSLVGDARDVICQAVDKLGAHMLVMGNHGYGALKRALLGSASDYCVHHANCPVLIVKKPSK
ncbi:hypothetical protein SUGI_0962270 [Cryptomeria japonica]|uniref:universal stress protein PHOS34 n=1 Tax=Cryptomeria japonica TaxID=3369 RepID=UPI002414BD3D|nr:universal stress protein PHOS34 [Cryptomeria japonica]GLJ45725.1 hypothetical protein SUGI_0962270 [Cryptomeria japonica]